MISVWLPISEADVHLLWGFLPRDERAFRNLIVVEKGSGPGSRAPLYSLSFTPRAPLGRRRGPVEMGPELRSPAWFARVPFCTPTNNEVVLDFPTCPCPVCMNVSEPPQEQGSLGCL